MTPRSFAYAIAGMLLMGACAVQAQSNPPPPPQLTTEQQGRVDEEMRRFNGEVEDRVNRGELNPDEAQRLLGWREWQLARQAAGLAPLPPAPPRRAPPRVAVDAPVVVAPPYYRSYEPPLVYSTPYPYAVPYYVAPWWGPAICAGSWGRHGGGRVCF